MIRMEISGLPKVITNARGNWKVAWIEARKWKRLVLQVVVLGGHQIKTPWKRVRLHLTRFSSTEPDIDNLASSFKHVIDGLVYAGVIENDKPSNFAELKFKWEKAAPKRGKIRIEIESAETNEPER